MMMAAMVMTSLTACDSVSKKDIGAVSGAVVGGLLGSLVGRDSGKAVAVLVGAAVGGMVGSMIGDSLDKADQAKAALAAQRAATTPGSERISWQSDKTPGVFGYAEPVAPPPEPKTSRTSDAEAKPVAANGAPDGANCRRIREVVYIDGKETKQESNYCLTDGKWARV